jgi:uncharacterized protein YecE (DUF72 family)
MKGKIYVGTSGWHYKHWSGTFYPKTVKPNKQFDFYEKHFQTVELNNSFYRLPSPATFAGWRKNSRNGFVFSVKASRYITHQKKLKDPKESFKKFFQHVRHLRDKLGPILFQLPPSWKVNVERLTAFLKILPKHFRYVFEFRNQTWYTSEVFNLLMKHNCAFCIYELAGHHSPIEITADFVYVRLHGPGDKYQGSYSKRKLSQWANQCELWQRKGLDVFVYFDNDQFGYAAHNALTLQQELLESSVSQNTKSVVVDYAYGDR